MGGTPPSGDELDADDTKVILWAQRRAIGPSGGAWMAAGVVCCSFALGFAAVLGDRLGDYPLMLLLLPLAAGAVAFGVRGGVSVGLLESSLATVWWLEHGQHGGVPWLVSRTLTYLVIGAVIGWAVDSRAELLHGLTHHNELSLDLIATASFGGYFTQLNPAFSRTLGYTNEELMAQPLLNFVHPDDREPTLQAITRRTKVGEEGSNFQNRFRTKDGSYRWFEWTSRPDQAREMVAVARDVTERKRLEGIEHEHTELLELAVREGTRDLGEARLETLQRLALAAEYRDDETHQHTDRVGNTAALIAEQLGLPEATVALIRLAAPLHDVGKLALTDRILLKPGKLTTEEFQHMQEHVTAGAKLLSGSNSKVLQMGEEIARTHHERWDGTGYPSMLRGEEIPISGRIVAVADVFDALVHGRTYKVAWPVEHALAEIERLSGRQFDPRVVEAFVALDHHALLDSQRLAHLAVVA
jgi:PAS domain S-box-containing protein/putative nucleotidyltransferase with HDIG domain